MYTFRKTTIATAVCALIATAPFAAQAEFAHYYDDTLSWSDGDIDASTGTSWDAEGTTLEYSVYFDDVDEIWKYRYEWSADHKALSHIIFELTSEGDLGAFDYDDLMDGGTEGGEIGSYGKGDKSNPGLEFDLYGIKFDTSGDGLDAYFEIITERGPMWGNFYAKDGVEQLPYSSKLEKLTAMSETGDLSKGQKKKLAKLESRRDRDLELLAMSDEERSELGKKASKRLKKLERKIDRQKTWVYAYNAGYLSDDEIEFNPDGTLANFFDDRILVPDSFEGRPPSEIPVPAAVWLFGSGLLGLVGVARRRKQI